MLFRRLVSCRVASVVGRQRVASWSTDVYGKKWQEGKPEEGIRLLRQDIRSSQHVNDKTSLQKKLLDMLLGVSQYEEGVHLANEILEREAKCAQTLFQRGECLERLGRVEEAIDSYQRCLGACEEKDRSTRVSCLLRYGRLLGGEKGLSLLSEALDLGSSFDSFSREYILLSRGQVYYAMQRLQEANADFDAVIELNPKCAPAYASKGDIALLQRDHILALHNYDRFWDMHEQYYASRSAWLNKKTSFGDDAIAFICIKRAVCFAGLDDWEMVDDCVDMVLQMPNDVVGEHNMAIAKYYKALSLLLGDNKDEQAAVQLLHQAAPLNEAAKLVLDKIMKKE